MVVKHTQRHCRAVQLLMPDNRETTVSGKQNPFGILLKYKQPCLFQRFQPFFCRWAEHSDRPSERYFKKRYFKNRRDYACTEIQRPCRANNGNQGFQTA